MYIIKGYRYRTLSKISITANSQQEHIVMGDEDEYACVNRSQLKIKDNSGIKKKKKKKSSKETEKRIENEVKQHVKQNTDCKTKAEMAFQKMQEKMVCMQPSLFVYDHSSWHDWYYW